MTQQKSAEETTVYVKKDDPLCPVTFSIEPDGLMRTSTIESRRIWVANTDRKYASIGIMLRCVCDPEATPEEFEYAKSIAAFVKRGIDQMLDRTSEPEAKSLPAANGEAVPDGYVRTSDGVDRKLIGEGKGPRDRTCESKSRQNKRTRKSD